MKKAFFIFVFIIGFSNVQAQFNFQPGVRVGANISTITNIEANHKIGLHLGTFSTLNFTRFYALQPELDYSLQGAKNLRKDKNEYYDGFKYYKKTEDVSLHYIGIHIMNKFKYKGFFLNIGPGLEYIINSNKKVYSGGDLTFSYGLGYDISRHFGVDLRIKVGARNVFESDEDYVAHKTNFVFQIGGYYNFF